MCLNQESQYHTRSYTGLATGMIYFGYQSIPMYRFGFTAILYYIYIYIYIHTHKIKSKKKKKKKEND